MSWSDVFTGLQLNWMGLVAALCLAALCGYIGVYVVLKRIVFVGASLAQISASGVSLAFLIGPSVPFVNAHPLALSLVITLIGTLIYSQQSLSRKVPQESIIGIGYLVASALTVMFAAKSPKGLEEVNELLAGSVITITKPEFGLMLGLFALVAIIHGLFYKQFLFVSFDREMAATLGYKVRRWELVFYLILGVTISVAIQTAGLLSVFAYLVIPAVTGLLVSKRMVTTFMISIGSAVVATFVGFLWASKTDLPPSPPMIASGAVLLGVAWVWSKMSKTTG